MKINRVTKFFKFLGDNAWIFVTILLACTVWFENEHIVKSNHEAISRINMQLKALDEDVDNNSINIKGLEGHFKCIEK